MAKALTAAANTLYFSKIENIGHKLHAWNDEAETRIPFTCDPALTDRELADRLWVSLHRHKNKSFKHGAGASSISISKIDRETSCAGWVYVSFFYSIGD